MITVQAKGGTVRGSGSIVSPTGLILTNAHVIEGARTIQIAFFDGRSATAALVAVHPTQDLALIRVNGNVGSLPALLFDIYEQKVGDDIVVIGNPTGRFRWTLTAGKISQFRGANLESAGRIYLQTDAAINPGNSGGPILSLRGSIVAVTTLKSDAEGIAFGISREIAQQFVNRYK